MYKKIIIWLAVLLTLFRIVYCDVLAMEAVRWMIPVQRLCVAQALVVAVLSYVSPEGLDNQILKKMTAWSDRYSYCVYLTHNLFILGGFSLLEITPWLIVNILLVVGATSISAIVLHWLSEYVNKGIRKLGVK